MLDDKKLDSLAVAAIRSLCIDEINKAKSGHPGMALGSAPILFTLFKNHLISNPHQPTWINRDRFVLSSGHASSLLYTMLHVCDYGLTLDDIKNFRQLDSLTPGHPEFGHTKGVDATSGPLGQGIAQAVGMAMAERATSAQYSFGDKLINHFTYCLCGDGDLEEGLSQESISLAGHLALNKLILFYDSNKVTLDGALDLSFNEEVKTRFIASKWNVLEVEDGNDLVSINKAINEAKANNNAPTLIIVHTTIGYGSSNEGTSKVHGNPLGSEDGARAKAVYGYDYPDFFVPEEVYNLFKETFITRGEKAFAEWNETKTLLTNDNNSEMCLFNNAFSNETESYLDNCEISNEPNNNDSTRVSSGKDLNILTTNIPFLMGGSADVAGSVMTKLNNSTTFDKNSFTGQNINFGIREFAMSCAQNGMLLHGGLRTYVGCFLVFSDYMKSAIRTAALSHLPAIYLFSHDSIAVGEDGPTHQPIEHLAMLRSIPNVDVMRPCDYKETMAAWHYALLSKDKPVAIILSRQNLPAQEKTNLEGLFKGAYEISKATNKEEFNLIATGSEVELAMQVQKALKEENIDVNVISMPCTSLFDRQDKEYKNTLLSCSREKRVVIEMLSSFGWHKYAENIVSIDTFGASAPAKDAINKFGFTVDRIVNYIKDLK